MKKRVEVALATLRRDNPDILDNPVTGVVDTYRRMGHCTGSYKLARSSSITSVPSKPFELRHDESTESEDTHTESTPTLTSGSSLSKASGSGGWRNESTDAGTPNAPERNVANLGFQIPDRSPQIPPTNNVSTTGKSGTPSSSSGIHIGAWDAPKRNAGAGFKIPGDKSLSSTPVPSISSLNTSSPPGASGGRVRVGEWDAPKRNVAHLGFSLVKGGASGGAPGGSRIGAWDAPKRAVNNLGFQIPIPKPRPHTPSEFPMPGTYLPSTPEETTAQLPEGQSARLFPHQTSAILDNHTPGLAPSRKTNLSLQPLVAAASKPPHQLSAAGELDSISTPSPSSLLPSQTQAGLQSLQLSPSTVPIPTQLPSASLFSQPATSDEATCAVSIALNPHICLNFDSLRGPKPTLLPAHTLATLHKPNTPETAPSPHTCMQIDPLHENKALERNLCPDLLFEFDSSDVTYSRNLQGAEPCESSSSSVKTNLCGAGNSDGSQVSRISAGTNPSRLSSGSTPARSISLQLSQVASTGSGSRTSSLQSVKQQPTSTH